MQSRIKQQIEHNLFDMLGKKISDAINKGMISPDEAGKMILSTDFDSLSVSPNDEKQYISNLMRGSNLSGF